MPRLRGEDAYREVRQPPSELGVSRPLDGVRVLEVASWVFVPATAAILSDWGAEVIKVEPPATGDPSRGLVASTVTGVDPDHNWAFEQHNRGKRSIGIDLKSKDGLAVLWDLVSTADVFLTNYLPGLRARLGIDVEDLRKHNPRLIYAHGSALGARGPERDRGGYDYSTFWARGGIASAYHHPSLEYPLRQTGAFGDTAAAQSLAGGVAAALYRRDRTGEGSVVEASLLSVSSWMMGMDLVAAAAGADQPSTDIVFGDRSQVANPINNIYRTADNRFIVLVMLESDRFWGDLCDCLGDEALRDDPRFADAAARSVHRKECIDALDAIFARHDVAYWATRLDAAKGVWAVVQSISEVVRDPQVVANGYLLPVTASDGERRQLVSSPVQFDDEPISTVSAPVHGADTELVLLEAGYSWERLGALKDCGAIL